MDQPPPGELPDPHCRTHQGEEVNPTRQLLDALPSASDTYPEMFETRRGFTIRRHEDLESEIALAFEEINILRRVLVVAMAWDHERYAMHGNTADASRLHYEAVREAELSLHTELKRILDVALPPSWQWREGSLCNAACEYCGEPLHEHAPSELKSCAADLEQRAFEYDALMWWRSQQ